jgi:hypothetical protein
MNEHEEFGPIVEFWFVDASFPQFPLRNLLNFDGCMIMNCGRVLHTIHLCLWRGLMCLFDGEHSGEFLLQG